MAQRIINIGSSANKGDGDPIRTAFGKVNDNFTELYGKVTVLEDGTVAQVQDTKGSIFADDSTLLVDAINGIIPASVVSGTLNNNTVGTHTGPVDGDLVGSVFADNSTLLVDGVNGTIPYSVLSGAPTLSSVATSGDYNDLINTPVAVSSYSSLSDVPLEPGSADDPTAWILTSRTAPGYTVHKMYVGPGTGSSDIEGMLLQYDQATNDGLIKMNIPGGDLILLSDEQDVYIRSNGTGGTSYIQGKNVNIGYANTSITFTSGSTVNFTGTTVTLPGYVSLATLKTEVAASADFADFQARIAAL